MGRWKNLGPNDTWSESGSSIIELSSGDAPNFDHLADYPAFRHRMQSLA